MKKITTLFVLCCFVNVLVYAQQFPIFSQYQEMHPILNPASVSPNFMRYGMNASISGSHRQQWTGIADAPRTSLVSHEYVSTENHIAFGEMFLADKTGPTGFTGAYGRFSYLIEPATDFFISVGLNAGLVQYGVNAEELYFTQGNDIAKQDKGKWFPDFGVGAFAFKPGKWYAGVSVPQTFGLDLTFKNPLRDFSIRRLQHYYATGGAYFNINDNDYLQPAATIRYVLHAPLQVDASVKYEYNQTFWIGVGAGTQGAVHIDTGVLLFPGYNNDRLIRIGYSFENSFAVYGPKFGATHEINLNYAWKY
ncbi:MAG: hypothetical protein RLZZ292_302 [Bacteroidota bacterium]|jgi:type IX secretion system PorP/SprF family membrane protein